MSAPKLNLYCKALFLMHRGDRVFMADYENRKPTTEFFRCLLVSREFLRASQVYQTYQLVIVNFCDNNKFNLRLSRFSHRGTWSQDFKLTIEEIRTMNRLLNVQYALVIEYTYDHANEYSDVCRIFNGHMELCLLFDRQINHTHHNKIIEQLRPQLYNLQCDITSLFDSPVIAPLNLSYCRCWKIENLNQIKRLLLFGHQIEELRIDSHRSFFRFSETIADDYFVDFPTCPRTKQLTFSSRVYRNHKLVLKLAQMVSFFPNLTKLNCIFKEGNRRFSSANSHRFVDWIRKECEKIEKLREACLSTTRIKLIYRYESWKVESLTVLKKRCKSILKTTKLNHLTLFEYHAKKEENSKYQYSAVLHCIEPNLVVTLVMEGYFDQLFPGENEVIEEDDDLLIPQ